MTAQIMSTYNPSKLSYLASAPCSPHSWFPSCNSATPSWPAPPQDFHRPVHGQLVFGGRSAGRPGKKEAGKISLRASQEANGMRATVMTPKRLRVSWSVIRLVITWENHHRLIIQWILTLSMKPKFDRYTRQRYFVQYSPDRAPTLSRISNKQLDWPDTTLVMAMDLGLIKLFFTDFRPIGPVNGNKELLILREWVDVNFQSWVSRYGHS